MRNPPQVFAVQDWLVANLPNATGVGAGVVFDGWPGDNGPKTWIAVLGGTDTMAWAAVGNRERVEDSLVKVIFHVEMPGSDATSTRQACRDLFNNCDAYLRSSPANSTMGGLVLQCAFVNFEHGHGLGDASRIYQIRAELQFTARI